MEALFGHDQHLIWYQGAARAALIFFFGLVILRLSGRRTFANMSALDIVISVVAGSGMSETMVGSAPIPSSLAAVTVLVLLHLIVSHLVARSQFLSKLVEGGPISLMRRGKLDHHARRRHMISQADLEESMRQHGLQGLADIAKVKAMALEPNGEITVIKKKE